MEGTISDLHAADARYHVDCKSKFMSLRLAAKSTTSPDEEDGALTSLIAQVQDDLSRMWNSVEFFSAY